MFPSLRFMLAAVLSTLVILVIASSALISTRRLDMPMVLHPVGSRPLLASWLNDDSQSFEARFGPQAMLVNASLQLPPKDPATDRSRSTRIEFVASANAAIDPVPSVDMKVAEKPTPIEAAAAPTSFVNEPLNIAPPIATTPSEAPVAAEPPEHTASLPAATKADPPKIDPPVIVAAITPTPVPAKDPQAASDAPAQPGHRMAVAPAAAPTAERPAFVDTSRTERIIKPAVKKRVQIKRPKRRVVVRPAAPPAKPAAQTTANPFAALFGSATTN